MRKERWPAVAAAVLMTVGSLGLAAPTASALGSAAAGTAVTTCPTGWGSLPKRGTDASAAPHSLTDIRTGRHDCYDRLVFDVGSGTDPLAYSVEYVDTFRQDPS